MVEESLPTSDEENQLCMAGAESEAEDEEDAHQRFLRDRWPCADDAEESEEEPGREAESEEEPQPLVDSGDEAGG
mgnify:CR=1 FL=1